MFKKYSKHDIFLNSKEKCDIYHYIPYYNLLKNHKSPCTCWISHQENRKDLFDKFVYASKNADYCFSHSKKYMDVSLSHGAKNIKQIMPGVDFDIYALRSEKRKNYNKLMVGFVGRNYTSSNRKNPDLLNKISKLPFVELRVTGGKIKDCDMPFFYSDLDLVISTSTIEGGPMCINESLAVGVPIVCFDDVGVSREFDFGVFRAQFGNEKDFIDKVTNFYKYDEHIKYRTMDCMNRMKKQVINFTWKNFVNEHDIIWENM